MGTRNTKASATHRLEDMTTQEVSLVDRAANMKTFLTLKGETTMAEPTKTDKQAFVLPTEAKDTLIEGVADALEKLTGVTQAIKESTVEDSAEVPEELPRMIMEASELLSKVAQKFITADDSPAKKFLEKARRMTGPREAKLKELASMLREFGDAFGVDLTSQADELEADESGTPEPAEKGNPTVDVVAGLVEVMGKLSAKVDAIGKSAEAKSSKTVDALAEQVKTLKAAVEAPGESNSHSAEGDSPKPKQKFVWPTDFAAHVAEKRSAEG